MAGQKRNVQIIPCLDVRDGRVVKGVQFAGLRDAGDPAGLAARYSQQGADELTVLDVAASREGRGPDLDLIARLVDVIDVPLTVGGGIDSVETARQVLDLGASRVSVSTAALQDPNLVAKLADAFGSDAVVVSLDLKRRDDQSGEEGGPGWTVTTHGGKKDSGVDGLEWAGRMVDAGAGRLLVNSMDSDGAQSGFDLRLLQAIRGAAGVPVIASGGAGDVDHFVQAAEAGADAVLAASVFHYATVTVPQVREALTQAGFPAPAGHSGVQGASDES